jgi:DNA-directed RNA polymerase subunit omega
MDRVETKYHLVHLAARRAREINAYYTQLGEGLQQYVPPLVSTESNKPLSIAMEEIVEGKIEAVHVDDLPEPADPFGFAEYE